LDRAALEALGVRVVQADLVRMGGRTETAVKKIRHDPGALAAIAVELAQTGRQRRAKGAAAFRR
jgi:hypothetical protein